MRKWHRWLSVVFGVLILFIATTGVASHVVELWANGGFEEQERRPPKPAAPVAQGAEPAATAVGQPAPNPYRELIGWLHHIHSGEEFGPVGIVVSLLSGIALIFFTVSGMWMYWQLYVRRRAIGRGELFWK